MSGTLEFNRAEDDNREAETETVKGYHGNDDYVKVNYEDGTSSGVAFQTVQDAQDYIDKK